MTPGAPGDSIETSDGGGPHDSPSEPLPARVGRFVVESLLGRGGMGVVLRAHDESLGRVVALKALPEALTSDPRRREALEREARLLASVRSPHVAIIHGLEEAEGRLYLVLEHVEGPTLSDLLMSGALPVGQALRITAQIAEGLEAAHAAGVVHRDLKPANVKLSAAGSPKILDFGLARRVAEDAASRVFAGTPGYMSPEQIDGRAADEAADAWALGCVLAELLAGRPAISGATATERLRVTLAFTPDPSTLPPGLPPSIVALVESLMSREPAQRPAIGAARRVLDAAARELEVISARAASVGNLPGDLSSFIGRAGELADLDGRLSRSRLVTLTGVGGCGKTRLAIEAATRAGASFPGGSWLVELAPLRDAAAIPSALATALGLVERPGRDVLDLVVDHLRSRHALLILDNCEHLLAGVATLTRRLVDDCPGLTLLATSREALGASGEDALRVPSLDVPADDEQGHDDDASCDAVRLFADRARLVQPKFRLTPDVVRHVARACRRLDGLPLAIELAAARVRMMSVEQIAERLDDCFRLLTGGSRAALPRQQAMRATLDWSHDLLGEEERVLYRRLAAFAGGIPLEQALATCGGAPLTEERIEPLLDRLADKSLLVSGGGDGRRRWRLLETVRQHAAERLAESGEADDVRRRHRTSFLALAEAAQHHYAGPSKAAWLARMHGDLDNFRAAMDSCGRDAEGDAMLVSLTGALGHLWRLRGYWTEARTRLGEALRRAPDVPSRQRSRVYAASGMIEFETGHLEEGLRLTRLALADMEALGDRAGVARYLINIGTFARRGGDFASGISHFEEGLAIAREMQDWPLTAMALGNLGSVASDSGDFETAARYHAEAVEIRRRIGDRHGEALSLNSLAVGAHARGDLHGARGLLEETLAIYRDLGAEADMSLQLANLGQLAQEAGDRATARLRVEEAIALQRRLGERFWLGAALTTLAHVELDEGNLPAARAAAREGLALRRDQPHPRALADSLEVCGRVALAEGDLARAVQLFAASAARHPSRSGVVGPSAHDDLELLRTRLAPADFEREWATGTALSLEAACALVG